MYTHKGCVDESEDHVMRVVYVACDEEGTLVLDVGRYIANDTFISVLHYHTLSRTLHQYLF